MTETTKYNFWAKTNELMLGDVVDTSDPTKPRAPWCTAIVTQVDDRFVTLYRPYGHHDRFTYTGGVICYTGLEEYKVELTNSKTWTVFQRDLTLHQPPPIPILAGEVAVLRAQVEHMVAKENGAITSELMPLVSLVEKLERDLD